MNMKKLVCPLNIRFHADGLLVIVCLSLLLIGYVMMTSASLHLGSKMTGNALHYPLRQLVHIVLAVVISTGVFMMRMDFWERAGSWLFIAGLGLLVVVLIPGMGVKVNGSVRWLQLGGLRIQVSEAVKLISVIYVAGYVTRHHDTVKESVYGMVKPLLLFAFACLLLLLEPDFGSAVVILTIALGMMFLGGARLWQFMIMIGVSAALALLLIYISPYRMARVTSFVNPWADPLDSGFQLVQALISFGRGEWTGVGLGSGIQKLFYLPEAHTDFLFSVIAEELGLAGVVTVIALYSILVWRAFVIAGEAEKAGYFFGGFIAYGLGIWFGFQSFVNMGVNMGILPTKGLTLPLMSYGGGSMIMMCSALALLFRVHNDTEEMKADTQKRRTEWATA